MAETMDAVAMRAAAVKLCGEMRDSLVGQADYPGAVVARNLMEAIEKLPNIKFVPLRIHGGDEPEVRPSEVAISVSMKDLKAGRWNVLLHAIELGGRALGDRPYRILPNVKASTGEDGKLTMWMRTG